MRRWAPGMIEEYASFSPDAKHDDRVDAGVHGVRYLLTMDKSDDEQEDAEEEEADIEEGL